MKTNLETIRNLLVVRGRRIHRQSAFHIKFGSSAEANALVSDLESYPHAFVFGCILDRQINADIAWSIPFRLAQKLGGFEFEMLEGLSKRKFKSLMTRPEALHRFPEEMAENLFAATHKIRDEYEGNASRIWSDTPTSAEVVFRFLQFPGVGPKISTMAVNLLARNFKIRLSDYYSVDISPDVHVRRVFARLGLVRSGASAVELTYCARTLHPKFPGLLDAPSWEIGRQWCKAQIPDCAGCPMDEVCPKLI